MEISYTKYEGDLTSLQIYEQSKRYNAKHFNVKVDQQCDSRTGNMRKTIYILAVCRGGIKKDVSQESEF